MNLPLKKFEYVKYSFVLEFIFRFQSILGADSVNFDEFNVTVFEQISNSYQKLSESTIETPVDIDDLAATTEEHLKQQQEEEGEGEEDFDHPETPPPVSTVI